MSVVTDTRFVYQPVTRLSKTKGKIEVVIKVGSQFVQVTTTKKQEIVPGLRLHATVNDIFRLTEVDEAPTSIQTEDDSAFGLRTESGKIVMYFTSAKKLDILAAMRVAKSKYGKDQNVSATFERLIRPQDVPGTLLNIVLTNMASLDRTLRLSSYDLLCALCKSFKFAADAKIITAQDLSIPRNPSRFIVDLSKQLAISEPQLTADFLNEFFVGWESFPLHQRPLSLAYMAPWLPGLRSHVTVVEVDAERAREKISTIFRKLIEVAISDLSLSLTLEQYVWPAICIDEISTEIFLEELIKAAVGFGADHEKVDIVGSIIASLATVTIRGKLLSRLRKALNRSSLRPTRHLPENAVWGELSVLIRLCLSVSFHSGLQSHLFLPELFHIITMLTNTGSPDMRAAVHRLLVNTIHAICTTFRLEESKLGRLITIQASLADLCNESIAPTVAGNRGGLFLTQSQESASSALVTTEALASLLSEVSIIAAPTADLSNAWRARWMSLVASTAFQSNPAIQPRAFTVMGCLAREDVDDDLLYQVLVALRSSISRMIEDNDHEMLVAIMNSLTKMMEKLPTASRYGLQLFWLAISLVRLVPLGLYNCAILLLEAVSLNINSSGEFQNGRMAPVLLQGRLPVEDAATQLDESYGIHFNIENFHFALNATLVKGLSDPVTKTTTLRVLSTLLEISSSNVSGGRKFPEEMSSATYLALIMSRATTPEEAKDILWLAGVGSDGKKSPDDVFAMMDMAAIKDKELLLNVAIKIVDFLYVEDTVQNRTLIWLNKIALTRPTVMLHL
ncbi:MAG: Ras GTPase activating protein ira2 [Claussenomyces sp. TS43310]|nr:MAG: Ras GTPase activating protein ira2 [Claussenomyces sp. TS43310]